MQTRLPNPQVLLEYLNLYKKYREADRTSTISNVKWLAEKAMSTVGGQDPVLEQIDRIIVAVESEVKTAKDFTDWFNLIFILREKASEAKLLKYKNNESLLHETLHAMAGLIICDFYGQESTKTLYTQQIDKLKKEYKETKDVIKHCLDDRNGKGVEEQNRKLRDIVYRCAMLGDDKHMLNKARLFNLIDHLKIPEPTEIEEYLCDTSVNHGGPLCLQPRFCEWLYERRYHKTISHVSFGEFTKNAVDKAEKDKQKKEAEEKARLDKLRTAAARLSSMPNPPQSGSGEPRPFGKQPAQNVNIQGLQSKPAPADNGSKPESGKPETEGEDQKVKTNFSGNNIFNRGRKVTNPPSPKPVPVLVPASPAEPEQQPSPKNPGA